MAILTYPIYDTVDLSDSAAQTHTLFTQGQGTSSTKTFVQTNMRGSGQFPDRENFTIKGIGLHVNAVGFSDDDIQGVFVNSIFRINYNNVKVLEMPAYKLSDLNAVSGIKTESTASPFDYFGQEGMGFMLDNPITIEGGKNFNAEFYQALAVDTAGLDLLVTLFGDLDSPDINP